MKFSRLEKLLIGLVSLLIAPAATAAQETRDKADDTTRPAIADLDSIHEAVMRSIDVDGKVRSTARWDDGLQQIQFWPNWPNWGNWNNWNNWGNWRNF